MKKIIIVGVILLLLGSSVPALAKTHFSLSKTLSSSSSSSTEDYQVYIGAGFIRDKGEGKFGVGWHMTIINTGDTNITGFFYGNETNLFGKFLPGSNAGPFSIEPGVMIVAGSSFYYLHLLVFVHLTVQIGNMTYSKSGYGIGPFVLLVG
jgi:hypothetical protein